MDENWLVSVVHLRKCKLWVGGMEHLEFQYGGLKMKSVLTKIKSLELSDDKTPDEVEYLEALRKTRDNPLDVE